MKKLLILIALLPLLIGCSGRKKVDTYVTISALPAPLDYHKQKRDSVTLIIDSLDQRYNFQKQMQWNYINAGWAALPNTDLAQKNLNKSERWSQMKAKTHEQIMYQISIRLKINRE